MNYFWFVAIAVIWGTTWGAIKLSLLGFPPFAGAMIRFAVAIVALLAFARLRGIALRMPPGAMRYVIVSAILLYVIDYGLIYWGEQYLSSGVTAILFATLPLTTALVSIFLFRIESFSPRVSIGVVIGIAGVAIVFWDQLLATRFDPNAVVASIAILIAVVAAAFNVAIAKKHLMTVHPVALTVHQLVWGTIGLGAVAALLGEFVRIEPNMISVLATLYLGLFGSALAFVVYYMLLQKMSASALSTITFITPLIAVVSGSLFLGESVGLRTVAGALVIFVGIALVRLDVVRVRAFAGTRGAASVAAEK